MMQRIFMIIFSIALLHLDCVNGVNCRENNMVPDIRNPGKCVCDKVKCCYHKDSREQLLENPKLSDGITCTPDHKCICDSNKGLVKADNGKCKLASAKKSNENDAQYGKSRKKGLKSQKIFWGNFQREKFFEKKVVHFCLKQREKNFLGN